MYSRCCVGFYSHWERTWKFVFVGALVFLVFAVQTVYGIDEGIEEPLKEAPYQRQQIVAGRFGKKQLQPLLQKTYSLKDWIGQLVVGQDRAARLLQDRLVQYLENYGSRDLDPIAMHLIGLPGVGKGAILAALEKLGIEVLRIDCQKFIGENVHDEMKNLKVQLAKIAKSNAPAIVLFDELDKVSEVIQEGGGTSEKSNPLIGLFNQILNDGKVTLETEEIKLSHLMIMSAMNFSPREIASFSKKALGVEKDFYEFTIEDFAKFDAWLKGNTHAPALVLSHLFRSNTVGRLVPNLVILKPLNDEDYRKIARINVVDTIKKATEGAAKVRRIAVSFTDRYVDFLKSHTTFAPSGARDTVIKSNALTEQLISYGIKASPKGDQSLGQPRAIHLDVDPAASHQAVVTVTPRLRDKGETKNGKAFTFSVEFDAEDRTFYRPDVVVLQPPAGTTRVLVEPRLMKKEILNARFPKQSKEALGLAHRLDQTILGQREFTKIMQSELTAFLSRSGPVSKNASFSVFAGFPGIGKSELVALSAKELGLPVVRINLQGYSSEGSDVRDRLLAELSREIKETKKRRPDGKFILQLEELDKIFEINPQDGRILTRPAMTIIKDLLTEGRIEGAFSGLLNSTIPFDVDIRNAHTVITMNFAVDRFKFQADPRLTSINDVLAAWRRLNTRLADLKSVLGTMFLPDTVNRLLPKLKVMRPLERPSYKKIIQKQLEFVISDRLLDPVTGINRAAVELKLSPAYLKYLYGESVIPSEGGRYAAVGSRALISLDLENVLRSIPKSSRLASEPLELTLDYLPKKSSVIGIARSTAHPEFPSQVIYQNKVTLNFPPIKAIGALSENRLVTAIHEFGHAMTSVRQGLRFEYATVIPPQNGVGGYVKYREIPTNAKGFVASIYAMLGSRAMERIFLSEDPMGENAALKITHGSSADIQEATERLWNLVFQFGMDPGGGVIDRRGAKGGNSYATFAEIPDEKVEQLSLVLKDMENHLVNDLLAAHSKDWYREKIAKFARVGGVTEREFYDLIHFPFPGENAFSLGSKTRVVEEFGNVAEQVPSEVRLAAEYKQGLTQTNAQKNLEIAMNRLEEILKRRLHSTGDPKAQPACLGYFKNLLGP